MKFVAKMTDFPQYLGNSGTLCLREVYDTWRQIQVNKNHNLCKFLMQFMLYMIHHKVHRSDLFIIQVMQIHNAF